MRYIPRSNDEMVLHMLSERHKGVSAASIGASMGKTVQFVSTATKRVADADRDADDCTGFYAWRTS